MGLQVFQSLKSDYKGERFSARASQLKEDVDLIFKNVVEPLDQLELIDHLQRLGLGHQFHEQIKESLGEDVKGMLSLYEASYYSIEGESLMEEAYSFSSKILKECVKSIDDSDLAMQVSHALELPLQWRIPRFDARRYMDIYERNIKMIPPVLEYAKLVFNIVQGLNQEELKDVSRWWNKTGLGHKLDFIRDRLATSFLWGVGISSKPQHGYFRIQIAKVIQLITTLDDVYDVYATLDELELFTSVIERWDINEMTELPHYMKICFMTLYNLVNEIAYDILKEQNVDVLPQLRKS